MLTTTGKTGTIHGNSLFDQTVCVSKYTTNKVIWCAQKTPIDQKWVKICCHFSKENIDISHLLELVYFALALPETNAQIERVFSLMNDMWDDGKSEMRPETVRQMLILKVNIAMPCRQFYDLMSKENSLLKSIHTSEKYKQFTARQKQKCYQAC